MQNNGWPLWSLLSTVFNSISEVGLLCVAGYVLARQGVLDKKTQKHINRLNVSLFTPSLLFSKVAFSLTPGKLKELWAIPIVFVVATASSMLVAYTFSFILRLRRSQRSFAMAASMFMNSNSLPIALMQSIVYSVEALRWGENDSEDAMLGRALTYLVLYSTLGMILRWSYGVRLLSQADDGHVPSTLEAPFGPSETTPLSHDASTHTLYTLNESEGISPQVLSHRYDPEFSDSSASLDQPYVQTNLLPGQHIRSPPHPGSYSRQRYPSSFPNTPIYSHTDSDESELTDGEENQDSPIGNASVRRIQGGPLWSRIRVFIYNINAFMTMPLWAALTAIIVACTPPLQQALEKHMPPIKLALDAAGNCSIPLTLVVLGAYFYIPQSEKEPRDLVRKVEPRRSDASLIQGVRQIFVLPGRRRGTSRARTVPGEADMDAVKRSGETKTVVVAILSRMVLTPLVLLPLLALFMKSGATSVFEDPVFALANVLLITSPPALTLAQITQVASGDAFERLISQTIFWAYCVVTPVSTLVSVVIGLLLAKQ